jgi:hypothetical protein
MAKMTKRALAALTEDAKNRSWRTALQGLAIDVLVGVVLVIGAAFAGANGWSDFQWAILGFSVAKSAVQAAVAFVMRRFLDLSSIPTPLPPSPQPEPAE